MTNWGSIALSNYGLEFLKRNNGEMSSLEVFNEEYKEFMKNNHYNLNHYYRTIYRIIKYVDDYKDEYDQIDRNFYMSLFKAQLTSPELSLMFFNALSQNKMKLYIEKYFLLEHLLRMNFFKKFNIEIIQQYDISAFGNGDLSEIEHQKSYFKT